MVTARSAGVWHRPRHQLFHLIGLDELGATGYAQLFHNSVDWAEDHGLVPEPTTVGVIDLGSFILVPRRNRR
jgi:hypothetical protein